MEALASGPDCEEAWLAIATTLEMLRRLEGQKSWEWEDEAGARSTADRLERVLTGEPIDEGRWPVRFWQREFLVEHLPDALRNPGKTILDIGCGAGHNFRILLSPLPWRACAVRSESLDCL